MQSGVGQQVWGSIVHSQCHQGQASTQPQASSNCTDHITQEAFTQPHWSVSTRVFHCHTRTDGCTGPETIQFVLISGAFYFHVTEIIKCETFELFRIGVTHDGWSRDLKKLSSGEDGFTYLNNMHICMLNETFPVCGIQFVSSQHSLLRNALSICMQMYSHFQIHCIFHH